MVFRFCNADVCFSTTSAVKQLLDAGADPNLEDEFSSINQVAREQNIHPIHGE